jgi:rhodanese-related sulfurtransferase
MTGLFAVRSVAANAMAGKCACVSGTGLANSSEAGNRRRRARDPAQGLQVGWGISLVSGGFQPLRYRSASVGFEDNSRGDGFMFFKQFYLESIGHASYLVASEETGEALVLDVRRDVETYFAEARNQGMRIRYACDTHQRNDYVTGICELPERGDIELLAGARAELGYGVTPMADGDLLEMGEVGVEFLHTPGHTPEHISLLITDRSRGEEPAILSSGGALLVGDAQAQHRRSPAAWLRVLADPPPLDVDELERMRQDGAIVLDCRSPEAFSAHIPGAINVGVGNSFPTWAGSVLPYETPLVLVLGRPDDLWEVCWQLLRIGYELPKGWLGDGMFAWRTAGMPIDVLPQWTI